MITADDGTLTKQITIRTLARVQHYSGPDIDCVMNGLIRDKYTGPITLHLSAGRVASIEWREKLRATAAS
jgi:hypothetical protein